jgi:hypothetical protein
MLELPMKTCLTGLMEKLGRISRDSVRREARERANLCPGWSISDPVVLAFLPPLD